MRMGKMIFKSFVFVFVCMMLTLDVVGIYKLLPLFDLRVSARLALCFEVIWFCCGVKILLDLREGKLK